MIITTAEEAKNLDEKVMNEWGLSEEVLMENAGSSVVELTDPYIFWKNSAAVILCGTGNNGGDGMVIARYAHDKGANVTVLLMGDEKHMSQSSVMYKNIAEKMEIPIIKISTAAEAAEYFLKADIIADALIGTGLKSEVTGEKRKVIALMNESKAVIVSADMPSGMNSDTGKEEGISVSADFTVALGSVKRGHVLYPGKERAGQLLYSPIGIPDAAREEYPIRQTEKEDIRNWLPRRSPTAHKGNNGSIGIIAGSCGMEGAALLAAQGALHGGAGKVSVLSVDPVAAVLAGKTPEIMVSSAGEGSCFRKEMAKSVIKKINDFDVIAIGPGMGRAKETGEFIAQILGTYKGKIVVDADALFAVAEEKIDLKNCDADLIFTPHVGEFSKLTGLSPKNIEEHRIDHAVDFAVRNQVTLVLKGAPTVIALSSGKAWLNPTGNAGMATGGMGDTLTGILAALAGQGLSAERAAVSAVFLHGLAGDILAGETLVGYTASDVARAVPKAENMVMEE